MGRQQKQQRVFYEIKTAPTAIKEHKAAFSLPHKLMFPTNTHISLALFFPRCFVAKSRKYVNNAPHFLTFKMHIHTEKDGRERKIYIKWNLLIIGFIMCIFNVFAIWFHSYSHCMQLNMLISQNGYIKK